MFRNGAVPSLLLLLCLVGLAALPAYPQADVATATLKGTVTDESNAVIPGATVTVRDLDRGIAREATTDSLGVYQVRLLPPAAYEVRISAPGFISRVMTRVELTVGQIAVYDAHLRVGAVSQEVQVSTEAPLIETEKTQQANTLNQNQVENLPNIGRGFTQQVFTLPGVASSEATRTQNPGFSGFGTTGFSIGGSNGRNNLSTIDGGENEYGSGQYRNANVPVDSIQEFQVNRSSFAAEFGFTTGSAVNVVTKTGTNEFHGSGSAYFRNRDTSAANYFNRFLPDPRKAFSQNFYPGFTFGGPLKRNKLFLFTSYEFQRRDLAAFNNFLGTGLALGIGGSSATGLAQQSYVNRLANSGDPTLVAVAAGLRQSLVPQSDPNLFKIMASNNGAYDNADRLHNLVARVDYQATSNDSLNFRFGFVREDYNLQPFLDAAPLHVKDVSLLGTWSHILSPAVLNQARVQVVPHNHANTVPNGDSGTQVSLGALGTFGRPALVPYLAHQMRFQFEDNLLWTKGSHGFKFGASYRPVAYNVEDDLWLAGTFSFSDGSNPILSAVPAAQRAAVTAFNTANGLPANGPAAANLSAAQAFHFGLPASFRGAVGNPQWSGWAHYFGSFAQDSWKVARRLTVDYGVRFDFDGEPSPLSHHFYAAPRLGFAWDPWGDQKTVIRGGGGLFFAPIPVLIPSYTALLDNSGKYISQAASLTAAQAALLYNNGVASGKLPFGHLTPADLNAVGLVPGGAGKIIFDLDSDYRNPYSVQGSFSISRQLARSLSLEVGYNVYRGVHLQLPHETNAREATAAESATALCNLAQPYALVGPCYVRIDPLITQRTTYSSVANSIYHGLTASLTKRYTRNLQFQVNYTYSKTIDDTLDFNSALNFFRPTRQNLYRAVSAFDFTHVFVANAVYRTPFQAGAGNVLSRALADVTIAPIVYLRSGIPFSLRTPGMFNGLATIVDTLYATPFPVARNTSRGPGYATFDLRLQKDWRILKERGLRIGFIVEGTNILNRVNFNRVNDSFGNGGTGIVALDNGATANLLTGPFNLKGFKPASSAQLGDPLVFSRADNPRRIQFGLKLSF